MEGFTRNVVIEDFQYTRKCEIDGCKNTATSSVGKEGSSVSRRVLMCDECLWQYAIACINRFANNKRFRVIASEAFDNRDVARGTPVYQLVDERDALKVENEALKVELAMFKSANAEFDEKLEERKEYNRTYMVEKRKTDKLEKEGGKANGKN